MLGLHFHEKVRHWVGPLQCGHPRGTVRLRKATHVISRENHKKTERSHTRAVRVKVTERSGKTRNALLEKNEVPQNQCELVAEQFYCCKILFSWKWVMEMTFSQRNLLSRRTVRCMQILYFESTERKSTVTLFTTEEENNFIGGQQHGHMINEW